MKWLALGAVCAMQQTTYCVCVCVCVCVPVYVCVQGLVVCGKGAKVSAHNTCFKDNCQVRDHKTLPTTPSAQDTHAVPWEHEQCLKVKKECARACGCICVCVCVCVLQAGAYATEGAILKLTGCSLTGNGQHSCEAEGYDTHLHHDLRCKWGPPQKAPTTSEGALIHLIT